MNAGMHEGGVLHYPTLAVLQIWQPVPGTFYDRKVHCVTRDGFYVVRFTPQRSM